MSYVTELSAALKMTSPDICYSRSHSLRAGMLWTGWKKYKIVFSKGLLKAFERNEIDAKILKSILGHELAHGYNYDRLMKNCLDILSFFNYLYGYFALMALPVLICSLGVAAIFTSVSLSFINFLAISGMLALTAAAVPLSDFFIQSIGRAHEFRADLTALELTHDLITTAKAIGTLYGIFEKWGYQLDQDVFGMRVD